jgi:hypothetical protein
MHTTKLYEQYFQQTDHKTDPPCILQSGNAHFYIAFNTLNKMQGPLTFVEMSARPWRAIARPPLRR